MGDSVLLGSVHGNQSSRCNCSVYIEELDMPNPKILSWQKGSGHSLLMLELGGHDTESESKMRRIYVYS